MKRTLLFCFLLLTTNAFAQEDAEGCKDHPMFTRMPNTFITECNRNFNLMDVPMKADSIAQLEGNQTTLHYGYNYDSGVEPPSFYQIVKNHENALLKTGGRKVYYNKDAGAATFFTKASGKDYWIVLSDFGGVGEGQYGIMLLEMEPMTQELTANAISDELKSAGKVTLYINFDTGKSTVKSESQKTIDELAAALAQDASLKVSIEGHTDNVGTPAANKTLSEQRAQAVMKALVAKGIAATRLSAKGWGQEKPLADNATEDGKAKNRRVEIVRL